MPTSKQRRAAERRRLRRQLDRRQERQIRRRRINLILSVVGTLVIIGVVVGVIIATTGSSGNDNNAATTPSPTTSAASTPVPSTSAATTPARKTSAASTSSSTSASSSKSPAGGGTVATTSCSYPTSGTAARKVNKPPAKASKTGTATVALTTTQGPLTFTLNRAAAPCTVNSFISLAKQKYFDKTPCHRLVTKGIFVLQCGDPTGTGSGGPGYKFNDELRGTEKYTRGVLAMANAGANTNGSQFFIVDRNSTLGPSYTIFGKVSAGLGVIDKVEAAGTRNGSTDGAPKLPVTLETVAVSG